jgi:hypothetical protein
MIDSLSGWIKGRSDMNDPPKLLPPSSFALTKDET